MCMESKVNLKQTHTTTFSNVFTTNNFTQIESGEEKIKEILQL